jgi:hypothetical protein
MTLFLPIVGYVLAEGSGSRAMTVQGDKNLHALNIVKQTLSTLSGLSRVIISQSGPMYADMEDVCEYIGGSIVTFEPEIYNKVGLSEILDGHEGGSVCILVPRRKYFYLAYDDPVMNRIVDREIHGYEVQVISVDCPDYPLSRLAQIPPEQVRGYLIANAMETELYGRSSVASSRAEKTARLKRAMNRFM